jgi:hypothetical protein
MKFSARQDIEAPIDYVFGQVSDFTSFERRAMRQGADVARRVDGPVTQGCTWDIKFQFRGRDRKVVATLTQLDPPYMMQIDSASDGLHAETEVSLVALSQTRTRVIVGFEMRAKTLTARLLLQSLKLAKAKMAKRFDARVQDYGEDIEDRFRREA